MVGMAVDLHAHSAASDGSDTPAELVGLAAQAGLSAIALTDHDTLEGIPEARKEAGRVGIELISGVELACRWDRGGLHIVSLFIEPEAGPLQDRLAEFRAGREVRNRKICRLLKEIGIEIDYPEVLDQAQGDSVGRPHFGALLVAKGYVPDISAAFRDYLGPDGVAYAVRPLLPLEEVVGLVRNSGGVPVLAHPHTLGLNTADEYADFFGKAASYGLVGVECYYSGYSTETRRQLEESIRSFGLLPSGGSDYHGSYKPDLQVGVGKGDLMVPDRILEDLRARRS